MICLRLSGSTRRLKIISIERLPSELILATEKERQLTTDALVVCFSRSNNTARLKSISKKRLPLVPRLAREEERQLTTET